MCVLYVRTTVSAMGYVCVTFKEPIRHTIFIIIIIILNWRRKNSEVIILEGYFSYVNVNIARYKK